MAYKYKHFIPENIAPGGAKEIGVYDSTGEKIYSIPLGRLAPIAKEKLYSFGLISDTHVGKNGCLARLENALNIMSDSVNNGNNAVNFYCNAGDVTDHGYYKSATEIDITQFGSYYDAFSKYGIEKEKIYNAYGNHDSYFKALGEISANDFDDFNGEIFFCKNEEYTTASGKKKSDLFVFAGQSTSNTVMSDDDFESLRETLENNKDKRCFVFVHSYIEDDSGEPSVVDTNGNPIDVRNNSIFDKWGITQKNRFLELLNGRKNVILFHGHSHMKLKCQEYDKCANYTDKNGFKSIHIPSLGVPRDVNFVPGATEPVINDFSASEGYIVDVYDDCIVLNGMDFVNNECIPVGTYKIDTNY